MVMCRSVLCCAVLVRGACTWCRSRSSRLCAVWGCCLRRQATSPALPLLGPTTAQPRRQLVLSEPGPTADHATENGAPISLLVRYIRMLLVACHIRMMAAPHTCS